MSKDGDRPGPVRHHDVDADGNHLPRLARDLLAAQATRVKKVKPVGIGSEQSTGNNMKGAGFIEYQSCRNCLEVECDIFLGYRRCWFQSQVVPDVKGHR